MHLEYPAWVIEETVPLDPIGHLKQLYLIQRNKHREAAKMRRQRNMGQMKEQIKTPQKALNKMEISNLSDAEFKTLVTRMLKELSEYFNSIKKVQSEMKDALMK